MKPIYLVTKYVRDVLRMEPINFGIIVWFNGNFSFKFLGTTVKNEKISCDYRSLRHHISSPDTYIQWIEYWQHLILSFPKNATSEEVIEHLTSTNKNAGNYWIVNGGYLLEETTDLENIAEQLYKVLIEKVNYSNTAAKPVKKENLDSRCKRLLDESGLSNIKGFRSNEEIVCDLQKNIQVRFKFSYSLYNGTLRSVIEKIPTTSKGSRLEQHIHDTAFKIEKLRSDRHIDQNNALILYENTDSYQSTTKGEELFSIMSYIGNPINILDSKKTLDEFSRVRAEISSHGEF